MSKTPPSIFNDVIGPVMRGPSSSHTAAAVRIGNLARMILGNPPVRAYVEFDRNGSLATTHQTQGSDMGLAAGLMGWDAEHPDMADSLDIAVRKGLELWFDIKEFHDSHPNTYHIKLEDKKGHIVEIIAVSKGGGIVEMTRLDGVEVTITGDAHYLLLKYNHRDEKRLAMISAQLEARFKSVKHLACVTNVDSSLITVKAHEPFSHYEVEVVTMTDPPDKISYLDPVMPVLSPENVILPFSNSTQLSEQKKSGNYDLAHFAIEYESARGQIRIEVVTVMMEKLVKIMKKSIRDGLKGTDYADRILGYQSRLIKEARKKRKLIAGGPLNRIISYTMAMMEQKSSMGLIVAAPTAGSCGTLPGALIAVADELGRSDKKLVKAFLAAGLIGVFIAEKSTFAAEECGCQAECGSASGMAAAGLVQLMGGTLEQALAAASIALQNSIGMVCDPVANRVEVPCLGKNLMAAVNALACANMALAGVDPVIPLDEVIEAMDKAGRMMPRELRCTGLGGLSLTPTSKKLEELFKRQESK